MQVTKLPAKGKDYESGVLLHTDPQEVLTLRVKWLNSMPLKKQGPILHQTCGFQRDRFRKLWGKPSFCWHGSHYFYCWLLNLNGKATILVLTAKEHGTAYELADRLNGQPVTNDLDVVLKFFKEVICK